MSAAVMSTPSSPDLLEPVQIIRVSGSWEWWCYERTKVRRQLGLSCGHGAVTGGLARLLSAEGSGCAGTEEALWCGNSWAARPLQRAHGTRLVGCVIASMCVLCECLCVCRGHLFVLFPLAPHRAVGPCLQRCGVNRPPPPPLSVCYLQPSCHISPLCVTFRVHSDRVRHTFCLS